MILNRCKTCKLTWKTLIVARFCPKCLAESVISEDTESSKVSFIDTQINKMIT